MCFFFFLGGGNSKLGSQVRELQFKSLNPIRLRRWPTAGMALPTVLWKYLRGFFPVPVFQRTSKLLQNSHLITTPAQKEDFS